MASLAGKTAIITGASKGIGAATALALVRAGANVVINYGSDEARANTLVSKIASGSGTRSEVPTAMAVRGDAGDVKDMEALVDRVVEVYGRVDIVIANAAIMPLQGLESTTEEIFDRVMRLNVKGPFFLAQAPPHMPPSSVFFLSTSINHASTVTPPYLVYCVSKGAIEQMVRVMSKDLAAKGISVNAVAPGPTATEFFLKGKSEQMIKTIAGFNPHHRLGRPEEIADVLCWLSGSGSGWITGQVIRANGGMA